MNVKRAIALISVVSYHAFIHLQLDLESRRDQHTTRALNWCIAKVHSGQVTILLHGWRLTKAHIEIHTLGKSPLNLTHACLCTVT